MSACQTAARRRNRPPQAPRIVILRLLSDDEARRQWALKPASPGLSWVIVAGGVEPRLIG